MDHEKVNILLVDDQPAKLLAYEVILKELGENLVVASSGREALEYLLKNEVAVILVDVCMPELDGFELAAMIREHPRFRKTAIIFISAIQVSDLDRLRGYEMGAVDYVPVPVVPEVLRAKLKVFAELYRKTRELERLNAELEDRVRARTAELEESHRRLLESEQRRSLAIAAGKMGSWDWDWVNGDWMWDEGQYQIFGLDPKSFVVTPATVQALVNAFYKTLKWLEKASPEQIAATVPEDYYLGDKGLYIAAVKANKPVYSVTGVIPAAGMQSAADMLLAFDDELKGAKIDLAKTFDDRFIRKAAGM